MSIKKIIKGVNNMNFKKVLTLLIVIINIFACTTLDNSTIITKENIAGQKIKIKVIEGEEWEHKLKIIRWLPFIKVTNQPQIAIWIEDLDGKYLETLYVTQGVAKQDWKKAPSDPTPKEKIRRPESLPHWAHQRGIKYEDGLYVPTRDKQLVDAVTSATPKTSFKLSSKIKAERKKVIIKAEINHSGDFNDYYHKNIDPDSEHYGGGRWGSGQPAVIYAKKINLSDNEKKYSLEIIGHSSPSGENGHVYSDISKLTSAKEIVKDIIVETK